ncbi:unnamed protein product [Phytophthora fragariaefolia]|uniref:Unnamed protein product n=1 Tax=Phytophthora fragariaefolia TaxID=1490495 RepID=A0A9W6X553_9STRA|nr:unnamed protein product [Phytophthora fragariaefolia]
MIIKNAIINAEIVQLQGDFVVIPLEFSRTASDWCVKGHVLRQHALRCDFTSSEIKIMSSAPLGENPTRPQQAAPREAQNLTGRSKGRNFEAEEEEMLCKAYLHIGKDAGTGTGQAAAKFWSRVAEYYHEHRPDGADRRPLRSLEIKWAVIQHDVSKFCGCMANPRCSLMCVCGAQYQ